MNSKMMFVAGLGLTTGMLLAQPVIAADCPKNGTVNVNVDALGLADACLAVAQPDTAVRASVDANIRTLGTLLITNGQFRKLLRDATIFLRDPAGADTGD